MTTFYSGYSSYGSGGLMRLRLEIDDPPTILMGTASVTLAARLYLETTGSIGDSSNTCALSGTLGSTSGAVSISHGSGGGTTLLKTVSASVSTVYGSTVGVSVSGSAGPLASEGRNLSVSGSVTVGARPYQLPAAPTSPSVSRNSDTSQTVAWTNTSPASSSAPYAGVYVYRRDNVNTSWVKVATLGVVSSWTDTTTVADRGYDYNVAPYNSSGEGTASSTVSIKTTPLAPTALAAAKSGADIVLTWTRNASTADSQVVQASQSGGAYTDIATISAGASTYTHSAPSSSYTWTYKVVAKTTTPALSAASAASNTVTLLAPPNAPVIVGPAGPVDATETTTLDWTHNPTDTTPQTKYQLRYRLVGAGSWTTLSAVTSGTSALALILSSAWGRANGTTIEWAVATWGSHASSSPFSDTATLVLSARPTATISAPPTTLETSTVVATWGYYDAEGTAQAAWKAELLDASSAILETRNGVGAATTTTFATTVANGFSGTVRITVTDSSGMLSTPATRAFTVSYALPPTPTLVATWDPETASVALEITNPAAVDDDPEGVYNDVYRSLDGGAWALLYAGVPVNTTITDWSPTVSGVTSYRVVAFSALPSSATSADLDVETPAEGDPVGSVWLSAGPGFSSVCRAHHNYSVSPSAGLLEREVRRYAGRTDGVEVAGDAESHAWAVSFDWLRDASGPSSSPIEEWLALATLRGPFLLRDPDGLYEYVSISTINGVRDIGGGRKAISFTATKVGAR